MKIKALALVIALAGLFSASALAVTADQAHDAISLEEGVTSSQFLPAGEPKQYRIAVDRPATLEISSEHIAGEHQGDSGYKQIEATLYDASGKVVATASDPRGHFLITERVQPGDYILEVTGNSLSGSGHETSNRYNLHVDFE